MVECVTVVSALTRFRCAFQFCSQFLDPCCVDGCVTSEFCPSLASQFGSWSGCSQQQGGNTLSLPMRRPSPCAGGCISVLSGEWSWSPRDTILEAPVPSFEMCARRLTRPLRASDAMYEGILEHAVNTWSPLDAALDMGAGCSACVFERVRVCALACSTAGLRACISMHVCVCVCDRCAWMSTGMWKYTRN